MLNKKNLKYQFNYASSHPLLYNKFSRYEKASRIIILLKLFFTSQKLRNSKVLDIGCSTGIIDYKLSKAVKSVTCIDIDKKALSYARNNFKAPNLQFRNADAMDLDYKNESFDIIICTHVYEHVPDQERLISEVYRVLKKDGICYFAAVNKFSIMESHYNLPFLSWLPRDAAIIYIRLLRKGKEYYEKPLDFWRLKRLLRTFNIVDYTPKILRNPQKFGYGNGIIFRKPLIYFLWILSPLSKYFSPTFIWILIKK